MCSVLLLCRKEGLPGWGKWDNSYLLLIPPGPNVGLILERWRGKADERDHRTQTDKDTDLALPGEEKGRVFELGIIIAKLTHFVCLALF